MDRAILKQKLIRKCFRKKNIGILAYVLQSNGTQKETGSTVFMLNTIQLKTFA